MLHGIVYCLSTVSFPIDYRSRYSESVWENEVDSIGLGVSGSPDETTSEIIATDNSSTETPQESDELVMEETICHFTNLTMIGLINLRVNCISQGVRY